MTIANRAHSQHNIERRSSVSGIRNRIEACIRSYLAGERETALAEINEIIESINGADPEDQGYAYFAKGNLLVRMGRHKEALYCLRNAATFDHDNPSILYNLGIEEFTAGNSKRGREYLVRAAQLGHEKAPRALEAIKSGEPIAFSSSEQAEGSAIVDHVRRGMVSVHEGRYDDALIDYNRAIELAPDFGHTFTLRGVVYEKQGRHDLALADHNRAIELSPDNAIAYYNRGVAQEQLGQASQAFQDYSRAIDLDPTDADFFYNRGNLNSGNGRFREAIDDFSRAIAINPDYALAYNNRGNARSRLMDFDEAMTDYSAALKLSPREPLFLMNKGACHYNRGEMDQAALHLLTAVQLGDSRAEDMLRQIAGPGLDLSLLKRAT